MDVGNLEDTDTMQTLFDHLFVPASCAMSNVSATKTGVLWGKCYTSTVFWQCLVIPHSCTALVTANRHHAWVSFEATAEVYNEVNHATSNENANHLEQYLNTHPLRKFEAEEGMSFYNSFALTACKWYNIMSLVHFQKDPEDSIY